VNDQVRETLADLIVRFGTSLVDDPRRAEALLRDLCGEHRREISVLIAAQEEGIPAELLSSATQIPGSLLFARLSMRLESNRGLSVEAAQWAVLSWAHALQVQGIADVARSLSAAVETAEENVASDIQSLAMRSRAERVASSPPSTGTDAHSPGTAERETQTSPSGFPVVSVSADRCPRCGGQPVRQIGHTAETAKGGLPPWALAISILVGLFWIGLGLSTLDEPFTAILLIGLGAIGFILAPIRKSRRGKKVAASVRMTCASCGRQWP
jgi:hypothetical protein